MANNVEARDSGGETRIVKTTDTGGVHVPHVNVDNLAGLTAPLETLLTTLNAKDFSTQTTLAAVLARLATVATASVTALASTAASQQALAANANRKGLTAYNSDPYDCHLKLGATATLTDFTVKIAPGEYWEMPQPIYTGRIDAIWTANGSGSLHLTEI